MSNPLARHIAEAPDGVLIVPAEDAAARAARVEAKLARLSPAQLAAVERVLDQIIAAQASTAMESSHAD